MINSSDFNDTDTQILAEIQNTLNNEPQSNTPWISLPPYLDTKTDILYQIWQSLMLGGGGGNIVDTLDETLKAGNTSTEDIILQSATEGNATVQIIKSSSDTSGRILVGNKDYAANVDIDGDGGIVSAKALRLVPRPGSSITFSSGQQLNGEVTIAIPNQLPIENIFVASVSNKTANAAGNISLIHSDIEGNTHFRYFEKRFTWIGNTPIDDYNFASTTTTDTTDVADRFTFKQLQNTAVLVRTVCNVSILINGELNLIVSFKTDFIIQTEIKTSSISVVYIRKKISQPEGTNNVVYSDRDLLLINNKLDHFQIIFSDVENFFVEILDSLSISMQDPTVAINFTLGVEVQPQPTFFP